MSNTTTLNSTQLSEIIAKRIKGQLFNDAITDLIKKKDDRCDLP
jgi:hypothetical protein